MKKDQLEKEKRCQTCKWHDGFSWACCNGDSEKCADFTDPGDTCTEWEGGE